MIYIMTFCIYVFFYNETAPTEIYTLSLHDALPIWRSAERESAWTLCLLRTVRPRPVQQQCRQPGDAHHSCRRSEEHTSELQSHVNLVCRLLLEKKNK